MLRQKQKNGCGDSCPGASFAIGTNEKGLGEYGLLPGLYTLQTPICTSGLNVNTHIRSIRRGNAH
jgi:hypothetical protein